MFTQCRGCGEVFALSVEDVVSSKGYVRCSSCGTVFNSLETLAEHHSIESGNLRLHESDNPPPLLTHESKPSVLVTHSVLQAEEKKGHRKILVSSTKKVEQENEREEITLDIKPEFVPEKASRAGSSPFLWAFILLFSIIGLVFQGYLGVKNGSLKLPQTAASQKLCEYMPCYKSGRDSNLNKIALVSRNIRHHPGRDNALIITTGIVNGDENIQDFPALKIKLSDLNGDVVAMRRFLPSEYLDEETISVGMLPNTLVPVTLELQSPGKNAVTFEVGFSPTYGAN